jgi:signal transduction histidine kinase
MVIMGSLELVQSRIDAGRTDDLTRFTSAAIASVRRGAELTKRLLDFARRRPLVAQQVDARSLLDGMADLLRRTLGPMIAFEVIPATAIWPAWCDPGQFESAILNRAINSRDAMPDGGQLTIALSNVTLDRACSKARDGEARPGDYVAIAVNDTGIGMAPEVLSRATEPFFTTKPVGQDTGLGLSTIYGFVKQFGGDLFIRSQPDQGTTVTLYLPRYRDETADDAAALASP